MPETAAIDAILRDLDAMIGLEPVKQAIHRIADVQRLNAARQAEGLPVRPHPLDLVFAGEPGTGEDEVARVVARLYAALGLLPEVKVAEVGRVHLVGATADASRTLVAAAVGAAIGGVLLVSGAQLLVPEQAGDPVDAALTALAAEVTAHRDQMALIVSGPTGPTEAIMAHHPQLAALEATVVEFPRYTPDELVLLFQRDAAALRIDVPDDVLAAVRSHLVEVHASERFRTARYVPGLVEEMYARLAQRALADGIADPTELGAFAVADVPPVAAAEPRDTGLRVGFSAT